MSALFIWESNNDVGRPLGSVGSIERSHADTVACRASMSYVGRGKLDRLVQFTRARPEVRDQRNRHGEPLVRAARTLGGWNRHTLDRH